MLGLLGPNGAGKNITIYDNRTPTATFRQQPDGKYQVHLSVEAMKYRADGRGQEHIVPVHDLVDIGVLDKDGHFLHLERRMIDQEKSQFDTIVDRRPAKAGIDPLIQRIDRNPDDKTSCRWRPHRRGRGRPGGPPAGSILLHWK